MNVGAVILAAGESRRMGFPKQTLPVFGTTMIKHLVHQVFDTACYPITVVLGAHKDKIVPQLKDMPINIIDNPAWKDGMSSSIKMGLVGSYLMTKAIDGLLIMASDMPHITSQTIKEMIKLAIEHPEKSIVAARYKGINGIPVLFRRSRFEDILNLQKGDQAKSILKNYPDQILSYDFELGQIDLDTKEDYFKFIQNQN
jgi:molybdenum cofactor cytidylyltransferase